MSDTTFVSTTAPTPPPQWPTQDAKPSITARAVEWAMGQPFNNVLLMAIFFAIGWIGYYSMTVAIPKHLNQIQTGYEKIDEAHTRRLEAMEKAHVTERERTLEVYDRWLDRRTNPSTAMP